MIYIDFSRPPERISALETIHGSLFRTRDADRPSFLVPKPSTIL